MLHIPGMLDLKLGQMLQLPAVCQVKNIFYFLWGKKAEVIEDFSDSYKIDLPLGFGSKKYISVQVAFYSLKVLHFECGIK